MMAGYNVWQNDGLCPVIATLPEPELMAERGAFFGSILRTLSPVLWGDKVWLHRLAGTPVPPGGISDSVALAVTAHVWVSERSSTDAGITRWAAAVTANDLTGDLTWYSGAAGREIAMPIQRLVVHMFNHQTHHRGQVHAMLTAAGVNPPPTDLFLLPG